jgi:hypothetical protein
MSQGSESNRYISLFEKTFEHYWSTSQDVPLSRHVPQLLQRLKDKLKAEGQPARRIDDELRQAEEGARIAETIVLLRHRGANERQTPGLPAPAAAPMTTSRKARTVLLFVLTFIGVVAYCAVNIMFAFEHRHAPVSIPSNAPATALTIDVAVADFNNGKLVLHLLPIGGEFVGKDGKLSKDISLKVEGGDGFVEHTFLANTVLPPMAATIEIDSGDVLNYPFDQYRAELDIEASVDNHPIPIRTVLDDIPHNLTVTMVEDASNDKDVGDIITLSRSGIELFVIGLSVFSIIVVTLCSLWVAIHVMLHNRDFNFEVLVWIAALLFVIPTMRDALPGNPPYGSAIDFMVYFWLQAAVAMATIVLVWAWVRRVDGNSRTIV